MGWSPSLKSDKTASQNLTSGALSYTTAFGRRTRIESVSLRASVTIIETVTVTLVSVNGANYDVVLSKEDLVDEQYFVFRPDGKLNLQAGDEIKVQCTNANTTGIVYVTIKTSELLN